MRRFGTRRALILNPSGIILPRIGPYANNARVPISSLPNISLISDFVALTNAFTRTNPYKKNAISVDAGSGITIDGNSTWAAFIWCDSMILNGFLAAAGEDGGGTGSAGNGGSGGGGSGARGPNSGGNGGSGANGFDGNASGGSPGFGFGNFYNSGFAWPTGGNGAEGGPGSAGSFGGEGGLTGAGFGGGGGGSGGDVSDNGGTGGAGGGLVCLVTRSLSGTGNIYAYGGAGGDGSEGPGFDSGGGGGGGSVYFIAKKYTGGLTANVLGGASGWADGDNGTASIYELNHSENMLTLRNFAASWDNL